MRNRIVSGGTSSAGSRRPFHGWWWRPSREKISSARGGFTGTLDDGDRFGTAVAYLGDLSGNGGVGDLAVNAWHDDDGGPNHGAVWILFLDGAFCSDGILNGGEQCDDGNIADSDGCSRICQIEVDDL